MAIVFQRVDGRLATIPQVIACVVAQTDEVAEKPKMRRIATNHREAVEQAPSPDWRATRQTTGDGVLVSMTCSRLTLRG